MDKRYVILTLEDAKHVAVALTGSSETERRITARLAADTGADIEDIVARLKGIDLCAACKIEAQESSCCALEARKLGRRLRRLLERARGERAPKPVDWAAVELAAQEAQLRAAGWLPVDPGVEEGHEGDWTPPEDRRNPWDFERALLEMRRRAGE